ncbi:dihydroneopterin aldolase [Rubellimicrobium sp. CFH 75288]|uniref:dihydroneopterin aldolase n=1 Tax=Rubellimicrobium sp. CFH 75288 TaxID=2697034 RepID=UPI00141348DB|nr:dihydroneopterin aldolase [Rubellimicrobium sp. CFH 75288]NAZ35782.1 diguanylate cyclase [Rubellimicrobium sp. CFH 75288]
MTQDHPSPLPPDRIHLRDHIREVEIGAFQGERGRLQRLRFDLVAEVDRQGPVEDDVDRILSYDCLTEAIDAALAEERVNLLETLAERIAAGILRHRAAARAHVRVDKLDRLPGALGVEIVRIRGSVPSGGAALAPRPRILFVAHPPPDLALRLDRLAASAEGPLLLCAGAPDLRLPPAATAAAARRVALLALDMAAWTLASLDPRATVVATRTELDWALRRGHRAVWAPSKMVLDAVEPPPAEGGPALALWLARLLGARELRVVDAPLPEALRPDDPPLVRGWPA